MRKHRNAWQLPDGSYPKMAGGATSTSGYPDELAYPYSPPSISGTALTVDFFVSDVRRITRAIANLALQRFYVDEIFSPAGAITGGAVIYEQATENDLYLDRDVRQVEPGNEFPVVSAHRGQPLTAQVEKFGGKFAVTDEARRRNQAGRVNRAVQQLSNVITRKTQQRALAELNAAITATGRTSVGSSWKAALTITEVNRLPTTGPINDLTMIEQMNEQQELGYTYNYCIMNPVDWRNFRLTAGGDAAAANALLADSGIAPPWITNRQTVGNVKWLARGQVGELGYELPLSTETWRDGDGKQQDWFQAYVLPIMYVTDPFAILETTGHNT